MATWSDIVPITSPGLGVAAYKAGIPATDLAQVNTWDRLYQKHRELLDIKDDNKAFAEFQSLDPQIQNMLKTTFDANYLHRPKDWTIGRVLGNVLSAANPIKIAGGAFRTISQGISLAPAAIKSASQGDFNPGLLQIWSSDWDGKKLFDNDTATRLDEAYGPAMGVLAKGIVTGKTPGEIISENGGVSKELEFALNYMYDNPDKFKDILSDYKRTQFSVGRFAASFGAGGNPVTPFENTVQEQAFDKISGVYDAIFQIGMDPTTYLTFGFGPALKGGSKLAKMWFEAGGFEAGAKAVFEGTGRYSKQLRQHWDTFGPVLKRLKEAETPGSRGAIIREISINFPEHNDFRFLEELTQFKFKDFDGVTDAKSAQAFFSSAEHGNPMKLINGKTNSMQYYRSNHIVIANKSSLIARDMRNRIDKFFNKETDAVIVDPLVSEISTLYKSITEKEALSKSGEIIDGARLNNPAFLESKKELDSARGRISRLGSRAPLRKPINVNDDNVLDSIDTVNAVLRMVHPKRIADGLTQVFIAANLGERIGLLRGLYTDVLHSSGLGAHPKGIDLINEIIGEQFIAKEGNRIRVALDYVPENNFDRIEIINGEKFIVKDGPIGPKDFSTVVGSINWASLSEHLSRLSFDKDLKEFGKAANIARAMSSIVNGKVATQYTDFWSVLTLFPKLGVRGTVDELFFFVNYAPKEALMNFFSLRGLAGTKLAAASSRTTNGLSEITKRVQKPQDLISDIEVEQALEYAARLSPFNQKEATIIAREQLVDKAFTRFTGFSKDTLSSNHIKYLKSLFIYSPHFSDAVSSSVASHMLGKVRRGDRQIEMSVSSLTKALDERGYKDTGKYIKIKEGADETFKQLFHYREFYTSAVGNNFSKFGLNNVMAPINYAMKYNALRTKEDLVAAIDDMTTAILEPSNAKGLKNYLEADAAVISNKAKNITDYYAVRNNAEVMLLKERELLHGSADFQAFNETLVNYLRTNTKGDNFIPTISKMSIDTFEQLTKGKIISTEGRYTSVIPGRDDAESLMATVKNGLFELMDTQIQSMFRTPAYTALFLANMDKFEQTGFISSYAKHLEKNMLSTNPKLNPEIAAQRAGSLAEQYFTEVSARDASDLMLKYVDNPDVRTQLAFSLRNGARFYRATEDFIRRVYRMKDVSLRTMMRMRLSSMGLEASGFVHEDQQGQKYVMLPMDNAIFQVIDKPLRTLTGGTSGYSQPLFGDFTIRLTQVNPSFGPDAAMPTLSGPIAGANVWLFKSIIGKFGGAKGREVADVMDNALLGDLGDNITLRKAIVPVFLDRSWRILNADEKDKQEITAIQQAIAYDAAHGKGLSPTATPEEQYEYIKNIRISAHNVVVMRNLLGLMPVPFSPTLKETKDVPDFLKEVGIASITQEFYDIYENVLKAPNPRLDDPYEEALAIYVGKNPGKLVYTVSRADKDSGIAFNKTDEVKKWYIQNKDLVNKYGSAAWLAAPSVGDFSAPAYAWFEAAGMIKNKDLETYLRDVQVAQDKAKYFDIEDSAMEQMNQSNILDSTPANIKANMKQYRESLLIQNPILKQVLQSGDFATVNEEKMLNNLNYMINDDSVVMDINTKTKLKQALEIMNTTLGKIQSGVYDDNPTFKREVRDLAIRDLNTLGRVDSNVRQATSSIFIPILKNYSKDSRI